MTGNGKQTTYKNGDDWGMVYGCLWHCLTHIKERDVGLDWRLTFIDASIWNGSKRPFWQVCVGWTDGTKCSLSPFDLTGDFNLRSIVALQKTQQCFQDGVDFYNSPQFQFRQKTVLCFWRHTRIGWSWIKMPFDSDLLGSLSRWHSWGSCSYPSSGLEWQLLQDRKSMDSLMLPLDMLLFFHLVKGGSCRLAQSLMNIGLIFMGCKGEKLGTSVFFPQTSQWLHHMSHMSMIVNVFMRKNGTYTRIIVWYCVYLCVCVFFLHWPHLQVPIPGSPVSHQLISVSPDGSRWRPFEFALQILAVAPALACHFRSGGSVFATAKVCLGVWPWKISKWPEEVKISIFSISRLAWAQFLKNQSFSEVFAQVIVLSIPK